MNKTPKRGKFRIDFRVLSILLLLATIPLLAGSWWLFRSYESAYLEMAGSNMSQSADTAFSSLNNYLQNQIMQIAGLTEVPVLREAISRGNLDLKKDLEEIRRAIPRTESQWPSLTPDAPLLRSILESEAGKFLKRYMEVNPSYREIMVTDFLGRLVAASGKTTDYYQADEEWWKETYGDGVRGLVHIGDIVFDDSTKTHALELSQPFVDSSQGVIGVIKVVLGAQAIHSIIGSFRAGPNATAVLLRAKGEVISAPGYNLMDRRAYPATLDILRAREKGRKYVVTTSAPESVFGLPSSNFMDLYPRLNWIVATTGTVDEVLGELPKFRRYFMFFVLAMIVLSVISGLLISREESRPVIEEDAHLDRL